MQRSLLICPVPGSFPPDRLFRMCTRHTPAGYFSSLAQRNLSLPPCKNSDIIFEAFFLHFQSPSDSVYTLLPQENPCRKHKSGNLKLFPFFFLICFFCIIQISKDDLIIDHRKPAPVALADPSGKI